MKREDDRRGPLKADALRGFFAFINCIFKKLVKEMSAYWKQVSMILI